MDERIRPVVASIEQAITHLRQAQNQITYLQGEGSPAAYDEIADFYNDLGDLKNSVSRIKVTGVFEP